MTAPTTIRLPAGLRAEAEAYADRVGCSLSGLVGVTLRDYLDARRASVAAAPSPPSALAPAAVAQSGPVPGPRKPGFHDPCPCGSGKKFGKCHGAGKRHK
jgi:hypothetical protein